MAPLVSTPSPPPPSAAQPSKRRLSDLVRRQSRRLKFKPRESGGGSFILKHTGKRRGSDSSSSATLNVSELSDSFSAVDVKCQSNGDNNRRVRFECPENLEQIQHLPPLCCDSEGRNSESCGQHYKPRDYAQMHAEMKALAKEGRKQGLAPLLDLGFGDQVTASNQTLLNNWAVFGETVRGLEHMTNKRHGNRRGTQRIRHVRSVVRMQAMAMRRSDINVEEEMRRVSECSSCSAVAFASMMGLADQLTVFPAGRE